MRGKFIDLTGQRFGRLTVLDQAVKDRSKGTRWLCKCDCGILTTVLSRNLSSGHTSSCGCLRRELMTGAVADRRRVTKHHSNKTRLYRIWEGMKQRCYNPKRHAFERYGGRGITVCDEWLHNFDIFYDWAMIHGYRDDLSIDRIDNDKGYSPDNCRWATTSEQNKNRRPRKGGVA